MLKRPVSVLYITKSTLYIEGLSAGETRESRTQNTSSFMFDGSVILSVIKDAPQVAGSEADKQDCGCSLFNY